MAFLEQERAAWFPQSGSCIRSTVTRPDEPRRLLRELHLTSQFLTRNNAGLWCVILTLDPEDGLIQLGDVMDAMSALLTDSKTNWRGVIINMAQAHPWLTNG